MILLSGHLTPVQKKSVNGMLNTFSFSKPLCVCVRVRMCVCVVMCVQGYSYRFIQVTSELLKISSYSHALID